MNKREAEKKLLQILKDGAVTIRPAQLTELYELVDKLVEKPEPVEVSESTDRVLKNIVKTASQQIKPSVFSGEWTITPDLILALYNGWVVDKQKRWNVKVPHTNCGWYFKCEDDENENPPILDELGCDTAGDPKNWDDSSYFTAAEIEHYGLQDCERVEVTDDEQ